MAERIDYRGYRLEVGPVGKGWRAAIYEPLHCTPVGLVPFVHFARQRVSGIRQDPQLGGTSCVGPEDDSAPPPV
jgi:hypothetical protein